jgi:hypothetical protein
MTNATKSLCPLHLTTYTTTREGAAFDARLALALAGRDLHHLPEKGAQLRLNFHHGH